MKIESPLLGPAGGRGFPSQGAGGDRITQDIIKQIERLEERIREIAAEEDTPLEIKMERQNLLNQQIAQLRQQLYARRRELQQEKTEVEPAKQLAPESSQQTVSMTSGQMLSFAQIGSAITRLKAKEGVRTSLNGEAKKLKFEISLDESRGPNGLDVTDKLTELSSLESKIGNVTKDMMKDMAKAFESFEDAAKQKEKSAEQEDSALALHGAKKQHEEGGAAVCVDTLV